MQRSRYIALFLAFIFGFNIFYAFVNIIDLKVPYLNPPEKEEKIFLPLAYPPAAGVILTVNSNETIYIEITLKYTGMLVERQPILMQAAGTLSPELANQIYSIEVGFEGSLPYYEGANVKPIGPSFGSVSLRPTEKCPLNSLSLGAGLVGDPIKIEWPIQGDYSPVIVIIYKNLSIIQHKYENYRLPIGSFFLMKQERYNRTSIALSIALFIFTVAESISVLIRLWERNEKYKIKRRSR